MKFSSVVIGGSANALIIWLLMQYNKRLAFYYLLILMLGLLIIYQNQIFSSFSLIGAIINRSPKPAKSDGKIKHVE